jgi:Glu-tRNA(Gln) amidotransferase subunit E-like FAD-binding protein
VELDEEPPHEINDEALKIALQVALLLNCEIIQDTQIMRKTVIDGSNTSGFQRTVLIAENGYIETEEGRVGIGSVCLEEDAARIIRDEGRKRVYRLDRLGIPLIEIATNPDIKSGKQAKEAALKIGEILRACKVKRGLGTIRQDVNLSVKVGKKEGKRVELKGVQNLKLIEKVIKKEAKRQENLVKKNKSEEEVRKVLENGKTEFLRPLSGKARMYPETDLSLLHISRELINKAKNELPKLLKEKRKELKKHGLNKELIKELTKESKLEEFKELLEVINKPDLIAKILTVWMKDVVKRTGEKKEVEKRLSIDVIETILQSYEKGDISKSEIQGVMMDVAKGENVRRALNREKIENLEEEIKKIIKKKPGLTQKAYMGLIMKRFKGKVNPKKASEVLKKLLD